MCHYSCKISVIVPVYKVEFYLKACIESILSQTFTDIELVLVDDGSPDDSGIICDEYAEKDNRIKVIHTLNQGVVAARACGVKHSEGEWFTFVDSDDILPKNALKDLMLGTLVTDTNIVVGYINSIPISRQIILSADTYRRESIEGTSRVITGLLGKLYHRSLLLSDNSILMLPRDIVQGEDMIVNIRLSLLNSKNVVLIPTSVYTYNVRNSASCMHTFIPTIEYMERFYSLLLMCAPVELYRKEIFKSQLRSLHYITRKAGNANWRNSSYYNHIRSNLKDINLTFIDYLLLKIPDLYSFAYKVFRKIFR